MKKKAYCQIEDISFLKMFTLQSPFGVQRKLYVGARSATERRDRESLRRYLSKLNIPIAKRLHGENKHVNSMQ